MRETQALSGGWRASGVSAICRRLCSEEKKVVHSLPEGEEKKHVKRRPNCISIAAERFVDVTFPRFALGEEEKKKPCWK